MKKSAMIVAALFLGAATVGYSQDASSTGNKSGGQNKQSTAAQASGSTNSGTGGQQAQKSNLEDGSNKPGAATNQNGNDVGRYSDGTDQKSMLNSKEAVAARKKNMTESDTVMKKGSGGSKKNMRNNTGKTGNYRNRDAKQSLKDE